MDWKTMLSYISGSVDEELLLRNEYLVAENRVLRNQLQGRLRLTDGERRSLAELGKRLGKQALDEVASIVNPDTILGWHRRLVAKKFDGSKNRQYPGRPRIDADIEELVVRLAKENKSWGYDRIAGALANLGHEVAGQTVGNILKRHGIPLAPERRKTTTWREFIRSHMDVLAATDFFHHASVDSGRYCQVDVAKASRCRRHDVSVRVMPPTLLRPKRGTRDLEAVGDDALATGVVRRGRGFGQVHERTRIAGLDPEI